jgi:hypothetical protein
MLSGSIIDLAAYQDAGGLLNVFGSVLPEASPHVRCQTLSASFSREWNQERERRPERRRRALLHALGTRCQTQYTRLRCSATTEDRGIVGEKGSGLRPEIVLHGREPRRLIKSGKASFPSVARESLFDPPLAEAVAELRRKRPLFAEAPDPGGDEGKLRALRDRADWARLAAALEEAESLVALFVRLGLSTSEAERALGERRPKEDLALLTFSDLFLTAAARALLGESFAFAPLPSARLEAWAAQALKLVGAVARPSAELESTERATLEGAARDLGRRRWGRRAPTGKEVRWMCNPLVMT